MFAPPAPRARIDSGLMLPVHRHMSRDLLTVEAGLPVVVVARGWRSATSERSS
jgi:hypothetical protein